MKRKTCDIRTFTNIDILDPSLSQCIETRSIEVFWLLSQPLPHLVGHHLELSKVLQRFSRPICELLYAINTSHRKQEIFLYDILCIESFWPQKYITERCLSAVLIKHRRHVDYWNQPLNMRVCYLDCHEAGLCCYIIIHIENLLHQLQPFYFHLWPI
jgi:hypothetical protein